MTASASDNAKELPSVFDILLYSLTLTKRHAANVYGFTAYILFPVILYFGVQGVPGTFGFFAMFVVNMLFISLSCWAAAAISTLISLKAAHPKKDHDPRSIGTHAASVLGTLLLATLLSAIIQTAGYFLLIIPGVLATILFTFVLEEVVLRGHGPLSALAASKNEVQHQIFSVGWRLFAICSAFVIAYTVIGTGIVSLSAWITEIPLSIAFIDHMPLWLDAVLKLLQIALFPPIVIAHTVLYLSTAPTVE